MRSKATHSVRTVSFSGVDGAGKSTQIERLAGQLKARGVRVRVLRFWDDIATLTRLREDAGHKVFKGDKGVGSPDAPVNRRDKNVNGWPMTCIRLFLYLLDALSLRRIFKRALAEEVDVVVFDRYTFDELANLDLSRRSFRAYARFLLWLVPKPDFSFFLDAGPEAARARKPEYPLEFIRYNRENYLKLAKPFGWLTVIPPGEIDAVHLEVLERSVDLLQSCSPRPSGHPCIPRSNVEELDTACPRRAVL